MAGMARERRVQHLAAPPAAASHRATSRPERGAARSRTPMVRSPRKPRNMSSGPTQSPSRRRPFPSVLPASPVGRDAPSITSEWPPIYLVPDWIERSTPFRGRGNRAAWPRCCPSAHRVARVGRRGDGRDVLHLEGQRARRSRVTPRGCWAGSARRCPPDERIVIGRRDAVAREDVVQNFGSASKRCRSPGRGRRLRPPREGGRDRRKPRRQQGHAAQCGPSMSARAFCRASEVGVPRRPIGIGCDARGSSALDRASSRRGRPAY